MEEVDRKLSKALCVVLVKYMQAHKSQFTVDKIVVDMTRLRAWLDSNPEITDADVLDSALGYNNFCKEIVTATKSSQ